MRWIIPNADSEAVSRLTRQLNLSPLLARLLILRGVETAEAATNFLHPRLSHLHEPFLMAGMGAAVRRLRQALDRRERILIYGDYDVDGTMAVVVLLTALRSLGGEVETFIPHRLTDGYGMRLPAIERAAREGTKVVLSVDTGIREHEVIARAQSLGIDCIVTDHHEPDAELPPACAVLNPHRSDCPYPDKNLAGVGVAFKLAQALLGEALSDRLTESYLKLVAIGTVADVVPLVGENRVIVRFGLAGLEQPHHAGLEALLEAAGLVGRAASAGDVAFRLAPRLNAAGRMENARDVIELFTSSDAEQARRIAWRLDSLNRHRQQVEEEILGEILDLIRQDPARGNRPMLVFSGEGWHRGVIGIVAQRIVELFHRPALVIGIEQGIGQGSGRSIARFNLLEALEKVSELFDRYGGHAQAAGFSLPAHRLGELERRMESHARAVLTPEDLEPLLRVDAEIALDAVDKAMFSEVCALEPFGYGNPTPVFAGRRLRVVEPPRTLKGKHLKLRLAQGGRAFDAMMWRMADRAPALRCGQEVDAAFTLDENEYQGMVNLQLVVRDLHPRPF